MRACYATLALQDGMRRYAEGVFARRGLRFSALIGEILREVPPDREPLPRFTFCK